MSKSKYPHRRWNFTDAQWVALQDVANGHRTRVSSISARILDVLIASKLVEQHGWDSEWLRLSEEGRACVEKIRAEELSK